MTKETRSIEVRLEIDAPKDAVWEALTDPEVLTRWFPLEAKVQPGEGGYIAHSWGPGHGGTNRINVWEPGSRLQTGWFEPTDLFGPAPEGQKNTTVSAFEDDPETAARLLVDFELEGQGGSTVLRMVHSGFSTDARWDEEFASHSRGWNFELRSLRNYLEHHRGKDRSVVWVLQPIRSGMQEAWDRLVGSEALARAGSIEGAKTGGRCALTTVHGDRFEGEVLNVQPPAEFAATVENLDHSLLRVGIETWTGRPEAMFWLSIWGDAADAGKLKSRWTETLQAMFA